MRLYDEAIMLEEVTADDVEKLKGDPKNYIVVLTAKGKERYVQGEFRRYMDGHIEFDHFNMHDGLRRQPLTDELCKVFEPEKYLRRMERKAKRTQPTGEPVKVGDVFSGSWGYDATLWDFYEVTRVSESGRTVWVRELHHETGAGFGMCDWKCRPVKGSYKGDEKKHRVQYAQWSKDETIAYIKISSYLNCYIDNNIESWKSADNYH